MLYFKEMMTIIVSLLVSLTRKLSDVLLNSFGRQHQDSALTRIPHSFLV